MSSGKRGRKVARDVARIEFRKGNIRLALAILLWPPGWSHTRLEDT
jgi:hypothetical protein